MLSPPSTPDDAAPAAATPDLRASSAAPTPARRNVGLGVLVGAAAVLGGVGGHYWAAYPAGATRDRLDFDAANIWVARREAVRGDLARALGPPPTGPPLTGAAPVAEGPPRQALQSAASDSVLWIGTGLLSAPTSRGAAMDTRAASGGAADSIAISPLPAFALVGTPPRPSPRLDLGPEPSAGPGGTRGGLARGEADGGEVGAAPVPGVVGPRYPAGLRAARLTGDVVARFVIDTAGRVVIASFDVVDSSHPAFTAAVRDALGDLRYFPAESHGRRVEQTVQQTFHFAPKR